MKDMNPAVKESLTVQDHIRDATKKVAEQERKPITEPVVPWLSHKVAEQAEQEPVCECHRKTSAVISSERDL